MKTLAATDARWASFAAIVERLSESDFRREGLCALMTHGGVLLGPSEHVRENPNLSVTFNAETKVVGLVFDDGSPQVLVKRVDGGERGDHSLPHEGRTLVSSAFTRQSALDWFDARGARCK